MEEFSGSYPLQKKNRNSQHGSVTKTCNLDMHTLIEDIDDARPKAELNSCFLFLVDSELEKGRYGVLNFAV